MSVLDQISEAVQKGKAKDTRELVQKALDEGTGVKDIIENGLLAAMDVIGPKFKNNEIFVPEVLIAARAMNNGMEVLKPHLAESGQEPLGKIILGTVKGDLHDIGKNLVRMMIEGKGVEVVDLGIDVPAEKFVEAVKNENAHLVCCSALLTTTMSEMKTIVEAFESAGMRDKVTIMVGGAPVTEAFCKSIGADVYREDAASAAEAVKEILSKK